ncbi:hypothetical protein RIF29_13097 [Crotalaria pallida]|uniref:GATA transcription factor n=1 Tax=Crotalaria pallida TaxID=3830 RepID=A0AAN9INV6_CROPI
MEFVVAEALKPSLRRELIYQQPLCEDILCFNTNNNVVGGGGEDFSVDDLLDFSNSEFQHHHEHEEEEEHDEEKDTVSFLSQSQEDSNSNFSALSYDFMFSGELAVPGDDLAELEWVSHFVDDSLSLSDSEFSLLYPVCFGSNEPETMPKSKSKPKKKTPFHPLEIKITTKPRTLKNRKPNAHVLSFGRLLSRPSSPSSCSSSTDMLCLSPMKKQKKWVETQLSEVQLQRRCSHCQVQKTPQWRTGPLGPKTLCNACGVRYKSGRLFSEYRPACSPTFSSDIHSNSHRKVLEMRRKKEIMAGPHAGSVQIQMVPSY